MLSYQILVFLSVVAAASRTAPQKNGDIFRLNLRAPIPQNSVATATCLNTNAVQTGSESNGQETPVAGQSASAT
jgi:hypothetical protein